MLSRVFLKRNEFGAKEFANLAERPKNDDDDYHDNYDVITESLFPLCF